MNIDLELIEQLVIKEFYGIITKEEKAQLEDATDRSPEAWGRQQEIKRRLESDELRNYLEEHTDEEQFLKLTERIHQHQRRRNFTVISSLTAAAVVLCFFAIWYVSGKGGHNSNIKGFAEIVEKKDTVIFELPSQQRIFLGSSRQQMNAGNINISTDSSVLTYQSNTANNKGLASIIVPAGKWYKVHLDDGSLVHLNSTSKLKFPLQFSRDSREITIEGEAFVKVEPGTAPFIVHLPKGTVKVLGTSFNVNTYNNKQRISLVEGAVKVLNDNDSLTLKPGKEALIAEGAIKDYYFDQDTVLSWRNGEYIINNLTIGEIREMLFRIYGVNVLVDNDQAAKQHFSGKIARSRPIEAFLNAIKAADSIDYYRDTEGVFHIK